MFFLYKRAFTELHSSHACTCVVIFWWFVHVSIKSEFEGRNGWGLLCIFGQAILVEEYLVEDDEFMFISSVLE